MVVLRHGCACSGASVACKWSPSLKVHLSTSSNSYYRFVSFGWINCIGVFQEYYQTHQLRNYSSSTIAWIPSLEAFMMFFGGPIVGRLYDNYGPREILLVGTILHVFGLMMTSLCTQYYQFILAQGICSPIGSSLIFYSGMNNMTFLSEIVLTATPAMSSVPTWFLKWRALAFGVVAAGSSLGGVIFPIMISHLMPRLDFAWTMRVAAFMILGLLVCLLVPRIPGFY